MNLKNILTVIDIRQIHGDTSVKATGSQQCRIQYIGSVRSRNHNYVGIGIKAIQLHQNLIECLLAFVMRTTQSRPSLPTNSINFIDKNNSRSTSFGLFE